MHVGKNGQHPGPPATCALCALFGPFQDFCLRKNELRKSRKIQKSAQSAHSGLAKKFSSEAKKVHKMHFLAQYALEFGLENPNKLRPVHFVHFWACFGKLSGGLTFCVSLR